jgi:hypothetical protein
MPPASSQGLTRRDMPLFGAAHAAQICFGFVGASAVEPVDFLMFDALHFEGAMQAVPDDASSALTTAPLPKAALAEIL